MVGVDRVLNNFLDEHWDVDEACREKMDVVGDGMGDRGCRVEEVVNQMEVAFVANESDPTVEVLLAVGLVLKMDESAVEEVQMHVVDNLDDETIGLVEVDHRVGEEVDCCNNVH